MVFDESPSKFQFANLVKIYHFIISKFLEMLFGKEKCINPLITSEVYICEIFVIANIALQILQVSQTLQIFYDTERVISYYTVQMLYS